MIANLAANFEISKFPDEKNSNKNNIYGCLTDVCIDAGEMAFEPFPLR